MKHQYTALHLTFVMLVAGECSSEPHAYVAFTDATSSGPPPYFRPS